MHNTLNQRPGNRQRGADNQRQHHARQAILHKDVVILAVRMPSAEQRSPRQRDRPHPQREQG